METIFYLVMTLCALFSFCFGLQWFFKKVIPLYALMVIFGCGCAMLGRLFEMLLLLIRHDIVSGFQIGLLGELGSFLFFLAANYGTIDSLVDQGSKGIWKYRLIALAAPLAVFAFYMFYFLRFGPGPETIVYGVLALGIMFASYYNLKHLIIPDKGIIRHLRLYNLFALLYALLCMTEMAFEATNIPDSWWYILYAVYCVVYALMVPVLYKGVKKWTT